MSGRDGELVATWDIVLGETPRDRGGPFTIGHVIHSRRSVGFTGWIGGVVLFDPALSTEELKKLAKTR